VSDQEETQRRKQQALGFGLGMGVIGAAALALRYGFKKRPRPTLPESLSPSIFATRVLPTSHGQIVYHLSGAGDPLVFLHGVYPGASSFEWSRVYASFALEHEVIAPDLIGFGESERPARALDLREQAESLIEFLHVLCGDRSPTIVASGLGAKLACMVAAQHPEFPQQLILWLPTGVRQALRGKSARAALGFRKLPWLQSLAWRSMLSSPPFLHSWLSRVGFAEEGAEDDDAMVALTTCAGLYRADVAIRAYLKGSFGEDLSSRLRDISCPVSILWPQDSALHPKAEPEALAREIPTCELDFVGAAGLLAPLRHPSYFRELVNREIGRWEGGADTIRIA